MTKPSATADRGKTAGSTAGDTVLRAAIPAIPAIPALTLDKAIIVATKPEFHGCVFRCIFMADGSTLVEYGCYNGPWAISGEEKELLSAALKKSGGSLRVDMHPRAKMSILAPERQCHHCHYPLFEAPAA